MRITYVVSKWNQPTETFVRREVAAALAAGVSIEIVSLRAPGCSDGIVDDDDLQILVPSLRSLPAGLLHALRRRPLGLVRSLSRILRLGRPATWGAHVRAWLAALCVLPLVDDFDVVLAHFAWVSSTVADVLSSISGRPYAVFAHAHAIFEERCQDRYLTDRLSRASVVFVESEAIAEEVRERHAATPVIMRMGVPLAYVVEQPRDTVGDDPPQILSVGALREKKGHDLLIRAVSQMDDVRLAIAGDGPERSSLCELIESLGVADRVQLLGHRTGNEIRELLDTSTVFCLASRTTIGGDRDGVPNVLIEALARGVPVISTAISGIPDLLEPGRGRIVAPDDVAALVGAIDGEIASRGDLAARTTALSHIRTGYTTESNWARMAEQLAKRTRLS